MLYDILKGNRFYLLQSDFRRSILSLKTIWGLNINK